MELKLQLRSLPSTHSCNKGRQAIRLRAICFLCFQGQTGNNKCKQTKDWSCLLSQQQIRQFAIICFRCRGNFLQSCQKHKDGHTLLSRAHRSNLTHQKGPLYHHIKYPQELIQENENVNHLQEMPVQEHWPSTSTECRRLKVCNINLITSPYDNRNLEQTHIPRKPDGIQVIHFTHWQTSP